MVPALFGVSHGAIQFMVYEELKRLRAGPDSDNLNSGRQVRFAPHLFSQEGHEIGYPHFPSFNRELAPDKYHEHLLN